MKKIIISMLVMCCLLSTALITVSGEEEENSVSYLPISYIPEIKEDTNQQISNYKHVTNISDNNFNEKLSTRTSVICNCPLNNDDEYKIFGANLVAQSFIPTHGQITDIKLKLRKIGNPNSDLKVSIYDMLSGKEIVNATKPSNEIPSSFDWIDFDVKNTEVYKNNTIWTKYLWGNFPNYDFLFQTYAQNGSVDQQWTHCSGFGVWYPELTSFWFFNIIISTPAFLLFSHFILERFIGRSQMTIFKAAMRP
ncbi:MAG: hypothetical protein NTV74_06935, partial [Euryarchaeota archaeon]|nr:hypothetical protein [Euryarchaeota archaeon]